MSSTEPDQDARGENDVFVVIAISLMQNNGYLVELVQEKRLQKKSLKERWESHDNYYGDPDDLPSPFMSKMFLPPLNVPLTADEFARLNLRVGQLVRLAILPVGV